MSIWFRRPTDRHHLRLTEAGEALRGQIRAIWQETENYLMERGFRPKREKPGYAN